MEDRTNSTSSFGKVRGQVVRAQVQQKVLDVFSARLPMPKLYGLHVRPVRRVSAQLKLLKLLPLVLPVSKFFCKRNALLRISDRKNSLIQICKQFHIYRFWGIQN